MKSSFKTYEEDNEILAEAHSIDVFAAICSYNYRSFGHSGMRMVNTTVKTNHDMFLWETDCTFINHVTMIQGRGVLLRVLCPDKIIPIMSFTTRSKEMLDQYTNL